MTTPGSAAFAKAFLFLIIWLSSPSQLIELHHYHFSFGMSSKNASRCVLPNDLRQDERNGRTHPQD